MVRPSSLVLGAQGDRWGEQAAGVQTGDGVHIPRLLLLAFR